LRVDDDGERVPFTICDFDKAQGTITLLIQEVGFTTRFMGNLNIGDTVLDLVGPLGNATDLSGFKNICVVGGGIGAAVIYPQAKVLHALGKKFSVILGAKTAELVMFKDEFSRYAGGNLHIATDDGTLGTKGFVTDELKKLIDRNNYGMPQEKLSDLHIDCAKGVSAVRESGFSAKRSVRQVHDRAESSDSRTDHAHFPQAIDCVFAVGPLAMMRAVCEVTKQHNIHTIVSLNSTMVDGTGMCGCCRVTVDGKQKYACVDGPEFDGHKVDFDEAINRSEAYKWFNKEHICNLQGK